MLLKKRILRIGGMSCISCQNRIETALKAAEGVTEAKVSYADGKAEIQYDAEKISLDAIEAVIEKAGYGCLGEISADAKPDALFDWQRTITLILIILALAMFARHLGPGISGAFPTAEAGMGIGMLFVIGLLTSVHCVAMCGGINLSQSLTKHTSVAAATAAQRNFVPSLFYNGGRVISYTVVGGIVGAVGSVFSLSGRGRGIIQIVAGIFMAVMAANMLGLFPALRKIMPRLPKNISEKIEGIKTKNANGAWRGPLVVGLLNGLMPCGPLQAMQLYALSAGSAARGAAAMFAFALGTLPLMFALGAAGSFLASRPAIARRVMTAGAVVVAVMGISMFSQGWVLSGFSILPQGANALAEKPGNAESGNAAKVSGGIQILNTTLSPGKFPAVFVQAGIPVRWTIDAPEGSINGCNNKIVIPEYDIQYRFKPGENVIEFTPQSIGKFRYSCWMGMIRGSINVVADEAALAAAAGAPDPADAEPVPANYAIPTDSLAVAEPGDYKGNKIQRVRIRLTDEGFVPAVAVVEKGIPAEWVIVNESIEDGSAELRVPLYKTVIPLKKQAENPLYLMAGDDFDFATGDGIFFGYIKSVDDINNFDAEAVKKEAAAFETLIYSDEYYEEGANAGCCADNSSRR